MTEQATVTPVATTAQDTPAPRVLPPIVVTFDIPKIELGDIILMDDVSQGRPYNLIDVVRMLDRVIDGGLAGRPLNQYQPLLGRMLAIVQELANPK